MLVLFELRFLDLFSPGYMKVELLKLGDAVGRVLRSFWRFVVGGAWEGGLGFGFWGGGEADGVTAAEGRERKRGERKRKRHLYWNMNFENSGVGFISGKGFWLEDG